MAWVTPFEQSHDKTTGMKRRYKELVSSFNLGKTTFWTTDSSSWKSTCVELHRDKEANALCRGEREKTREGKHHPTPMQHSPLPLQHGPMQIQDTTINRAAAAS